ncbi:MAG: HlyC/CorC family transporter [Flavobacteriales bacterium]|nr:HlyC/CorC family transporter [Flavobacteriales bacterium]MCB9197696.1 HlyC/CorC family transporter [Flavobacteriales bacterium]
MDDPSVIVLTIIIVVTVLLSAFFSGIEIAFISANRLKIAIDKEQGGVSSKILGYFSNKPSWFIGTMLLGNNISIVIYSIYMGVVFNQLFGLDSNETDFTVMMVQTVVSTIVLLFLAEFLPKAIFRINANSILSTMAVPLVIVYVALFIPTFITIGLAELILRLFIKKQDNGDFVTFEKVDLDDFLEEGLSGVSNNEEQDYEVKLFHNALNFNEVIARDCMIPRNEIIAVEINDEVEELHHIFVDTNLSKVLVYKDSIDNIIGYVHSFEMFKKPENVKSALLPVSIIPESMTANRILEDLIKKNRSIAVVIDEFGGTAGMLTMEDVIEEIFGEIEDEHDSDDVVQEVLENGEYVFGGRMEIDAINEKYDLELPEGEEYETLAGFIIHQLEDIPQEGDEFRFEKYKFTIREVSSTKIDLVHIKTVEEDL